MRWPDSLHPWWKDTSGQDKFDRTGSSKASEVLSGQCAVKENATAFERVRAAEGCWQKRRTVFVLFWPLLYWHYCALTCVVPGSSSLLFLTSGFSSTMVLSMLYLTVIQWNKFNTYKSVTMCYCHCVNNVTVNDVNNIIQFSSSSLCNHSSAEPPSPRAKTIQPDDC